ncbi:MAG: dTMP kinase [Eubacterium sp.]|nr:dTMP kinase [Eubacterium sp.]HBE09768.1 dTMP kinase [Lachnospiraceae bacterium]
MKGLFISMEGPDGSGKSTQIDLLKKYFNDKGIECIITREPGGTNISEKVRGIILDKNNSEMDYMTELLLYASARAQLVAEVIIPALNEGKCVISDRFVDSSAVYQGIARGLGIETVYEVNKYATRGRFPDKTFLLDLPAEAGIARKKKQAELDRLESEKLEFHQRVAEGYREMAARDPERIVKLDATKTVEEIHEAIISVIEELMN